MKIIKQIGLCAALISVQLYANDSVAVTIEAKKHAKVPLLLAVIGNQQQELAEIIDIMQKDLAYTEQFDVTVRRFDAIPTHAAFKDLEREGFQLVVFLNEVAPKRGSKVVEAYEWRVYDAKLVGMIRGKKYHKRGDVLRGWAHALSDNVWEVLTAQSGMFSSKIAYCQEVKVPKKRSVKHVYVADYDGSNPQVLINSPTVSVAPRWNRDLKNPLLFYSECTDQNMRLMAADMQRRRGIASNFDGINMQPAFSADGSQVVYCASRGDASCQLYCFGKDGLKRLTHEKGNNISPTFAVNDTKIVYCADHDFGTPQLYVYDRASSLHHRLTHGGACYSPVYNEKNNKIAYTQQKDGFLQLFVYDFATQKHEQVTFDKENKQEPSWSPCGTHLVYATGKGVSTRIEQLNVLTNKRRQLVKVGASCGYPAWSPIYEVFPVVAA